MAFVLTIVTTWGIYALLGIGIVIIYRTSRVLNIAAGEFAIFVGFVVAATISRGVGFAFAVPLGLAAAFALGLAAYFLALRRIMGEPPHVGLMVTVGLATLLNGLMIIIFEGDTRPIPTGLQGFVRIGSASMPVSELVAAVGAWLGIGFIALAYRLTNMGLQMRAVAERVMLSAQRGINVERALALSWGIGIVAAGLAGVLHGERASVAISATAIGVSALIACLIGGMDSLKGALLGALIVGVAENLTAFYLDPRYILIVPVSLLVVILTIRPWGLFGTVEEFRRV